MIKKIWRSSFIRKLRRVIFEQSHLAPYLPFMSQSLQAKVSRLVSDRCSPAVQQQYSHSDGHRKHTLLEKMLFNEYPILQPSSDWMLIWYFFVFSAFMYYFIEMGIVLTYGQVAWSVELQTPAILACDTIFFLVFLFDILVQLNVGYVSRGMVILQRERVVGNYLHSLFIWDVLLLAVMVMVLATKEYYLNIGKILLIGKLIRLHQIDNYFQRRLNIHRVLKTIYIITKQLLLVFCFSNVIGWIFYAIDLALSQYYAQEYCWLWVSTAYSPIIELPWIKQYLYTLYWGVNTMTTISYGDIAPINPVETVYATLMFCFGFIVYGYVINQVITVIMWARMKQDVLNDQLILMDTYMQEIKATPQTKCKVREYLHFLHLHHQNRDMQLEKSMRDKLPEDLRYELVRSGYSVLADKLAFIFKTENSGRFLYELKEVNYALDQMVIKQGTVMNTVMYLQSGAVRLECRHGKESTVLFESESDHELIGMREFILGDRLGYSAIASEATTIYTMERATIEAECMNDNELKENYVLLWYELINGQLERIMQVCYLCGQSHLWKECPKWFLRVEKEGLSLAAENNIGRKERSRRRVFGDYQQVRGLEGLRKLYSRGLGNIEKKLRKMREGIQTERDMFFVDGVHEWQYYLPIGSIGAVTKAFNARK